MANNSHYILADGHTVSRNTWETGLNNNIIVVGPPGSGKTRHCIKPNLLQCGESMIVTDTKGLLYDEVGGVLRNHGFDVMKIDLSDPMRSPVGYNPMAYIRYDQERGCYDEQDILTVATIICPENKKSHDPFWDDCARQILTAMIAYVLRCSPRNEHNLTTVLELFRYMGTPVFDRLFEELCVVDPDCFASTQYQMFGSLKNAKTTYSCAKGILAARLAVCGSAGMAGVFQNPRQIDIESIGRKKTVVFLTISDVDHSMDRIATLFYTQALQTLCSLADHSKGGRLPVPVRFILDDFAAAADACIPNFDAITSVIRSREISVTVILQNLSQLNASYDPYRARTILNNADHLLYLGGHDQETAKYICTKANRSIHTILDMPLDQAWLFTRGKSAEVVKKYSLENHPYYAETAEGRARRRQQAARKDRTEPSPVV